MGTKIWSVIGKVFVIAAGLWAVLQLYNYFFPAQANLVAIGDHSIFELPDNYDR